MKSLFVLSFLFVASIAEIAPRACDTPSVTTASGFSSPKGDICPGDLIFEDTFDFLDFHKWEHENTLGGGGNWEFQWYTNNRTNSYAKNGNLHIRPSLLSDMFGEAFLTSGVLNIHGGAPADRCTNPAWYGCERAGNANNILNPIKSARLRSIFSFRFKYGRVEINAKLPAGDWLWPALWLLPADNAYGTWPSSGEIDLMESRGNKNLVMDGVNIGTQQSGSTLHFGPHPDMNRWWLAHWEKQNAQGYDTEFARYQLEWTPDYLSFGINDVEIGRIAPDDNGFWGLGNFASDVPGVENPWRYASKMAPFDQEFYIIMNLAVGGVGYFPDGAQNPDPKPWANNSPTAAKDFYSAKDKWLATWKLDQNDGDDASLQVDYVRVWAL